MALQAELPLRRLLRDAQGTVQRVQGLRTRLEEYLALPLDSRPPASRGHAAVLAVTILGSAAAERMVELVRWVERHLEFVHTLWPLALLHSLYSRPLAEEAEAALARAAAWPTGAGLAAMEYETTTAEDEATGADGDEERGVTPQEPERGPDERADEESPLGVNLYLYMEEDLEEVAEGLVSIPKLTNAIAEGLIVCRRVNVCFSVVMGAQRETARLLLRASEQVVPAAVEEALEAVEAQTLRALEAAAVQVYEAVRGVLNAVQRSVALMQAAMDGVETCAKQARVRAQQEASNLQPGQ